MNDEFKIGFIYGYAYREAQEIKEKGLFPNLTTKEVVELIISNLNRDIV